MDGWATGGGRPAIRRLSRFRHSTTSARRCALHCMFTAQGRLAMWHGALFTCTASAVTVPPKAPGADAQCIDAVEDFPFHVGVIRVGARSAQQAQQRVLGEERAALEIPPHPDADDERRARVHPLLRDAPDHEVDHALATIGRRQHLQRAGVLAAPPLGQADQPQPVARHEMHVYHRRRVVFRVDALERCARRRTRAGILRGSRGARRRRWRRKGRRRCAPPARPRRRSPSARCPGTSVSPSPPPPPRRNSSAAVRGFSRPIGAASRSTACVIASRISTGMKRLASTTNRATASLIAAASMFLPFEHMVWTPCRGRRDPDVIGTLPGFV